MKNKFLKPALMSAASTLVLCLSGCAKSLPSVQLGVQPWERDVLAKRSMQLDTRPLVSAADTHIYFSKEGSSGGRSATGGGCGCN